MPIKKHIEHIAIYLCKVQFSIMKYNIGTVGELKKGEKRAKDYIRT